MISFFQSPRVRVALCAAIAFLVPFLLFLPSIRFPLVALDDSVYVSGNPLSTVPLTLHNVKQAFASPSPAPMYVPLLWISYMADATLWGNHSWAFHLDNVLLHALNGILFFFLLRRLAVRFLPLARSLETPAAPAIAPLMLSLLWSVHPLRVESVAWVAERKDCLAVFFCLSTILAWLPAIAPNASTKRSIAFGFLAFLVFAMGLLCKPSLVPVPVLLLLLALPPFSSPRPLWRTGLSLLPFFIVAVVFSQITTSLHGLFNTFDAPPLLQRIATIPSVFLFYVSKTILPRHLSVIYPVWTSPLWGGFLLFLPFPALAVVLFRTRHDAPLVWLGAVWTAVFFLPVSGIVPVPFNLVADRFTCLPAIGLSISLLPVLTSLGVPSKTEKARGLLTASASVASFVTLPILALLATATIFQLPVWRSNATLYIPARRLTPDHPTIRGFDALNARQRGDFAVARVCTARAFQPAGENAVSFDYPLFLGDIPNVTALEGPEAALERLLSCPPPFKDRPKWADLTATALLTLDRNEEALSTVIQALPSITVADSTRKALLNEGMIAAFRTGKTNDALHFARLSGSFPPDFSGPLALPHFLSYYLYLWHNDDRVPALAYFRQIAADYPDPGVLNNIAWILASAFYSPAPSSEAVDLAHKALDLLPQGSPFRPTLLDTLAVTLANDGQFDAADAVVSEAISLLPPSSPALPAMQRRLDLYRQSLPYREIKEKPVPPSEYAYDPHL